MSAAAAALGGSIDLTTNGAGSNNGNSAFKNVDLCGVSIPSFATSLNQEKNCHGHSRKLVSGRFCTGKKEVLQKEVWPHHLVDTTFKPGGCDYNDMGWVELCNGFTAKILMQCDESNMPIAALNQLRHLNRISAYGLFAPLEPVLEFNASLMTGVENRSQDWKNWNRIQAFHETHVQNLKLSAHRNTHNKNSETKSDNKIDKDANKLKEQKGKCTKSWALSQNICFAFQNENCQESNGHDDGNGNMLTHCCAWCYYRDNGLKLHSNSTCKDKKNPFGPFKSANKKTSGAGNTQDQ